MIETTGYYINASEERAKIKNQEEEKAIKMIKDAQYQDKITPKVERIFKGARSVFEQEFNYYSFGVKINEENFREIIEQTYPKTLEA